MLCAVHDEINLRIFVNMAKLFWASFFRCLNTLYTAGKQGSFCVPAKPINRMIPGRSNPALVSLTLKRKSCHLTKLSSLAALEVVKMTTSSVASDENFIKMTTFPFQWTLPFWRWSVHVSFLIRSVVHTPPWSTGPRSVRATRRYRWDQPTFWKVENTVKSLI